MLHYVFKFIQINLCAYTLKSSVTTKMFMLYCFFKFMQINLHFKTNITTMCDTTISKVQ